MPRKRWNRQQLERLEREPYAPVTRPVAVIRYATDARHGLYSTRVVTAVGSASPETLAIVRRLVVAGRV